MSRLVFLFSLFLASWMQGIAQSGFAAPQPRVDQRVELLSIVFRLAGNEEYNMEHFKTYVADIRQHFDPFKQHAVVQFARKMAADRGIAFDAVMFMAIHLTQPPELKPIIPFTQKVPEPRWRPAEAREFVTLLQQFYRESGAADFFARHAGLYDTAARRFSSVLQQVRFNWFKNFYGQVPEGNFNLVIGLGNGGANYGPHLRYPDGREALYAITGTWATDSTGLPVYDISAYIPTIVHEFNHSFINRMVARHEKALKVSGSTIFKAVSSSMGAMAYGSWKTMIDESLVRASVIRYLMQHEPDSSQMRANIHRERNRGFLWMEDLVRLLDEYENNRSQYPTLSAFMPRLTVFFNDFAHRIDTVKSDFESRRPMVVSMEPFANGATNVDTSITEIIVHFDRPLDPRYMSLDRLQGAEIQVPEMPVYINNNRAIRMKVKLVPGALHGFVLTDLSFQSPEGYPLKPYSVRFTTKK